MPTPIKVPELGESVFEATVLEWMKQEGDSVQSGEAVVVLETDKVNVEVAAETTGTLASIDHPAGDDVQVGDVLGTVAAKEAANATAEPKSDKAKSEDETKQEPETSEAKPESEAIATPVATEEKATDKVHITPVAKRLAQEHNIDLQKLSSSESGQKITKKDVETYIDNIDKQADGGETTAKETQEKKASKPTPKTEEREERVRLSRRRRTIAQRLVEAQQTTAMLTTFNEVDMTAIMELRSRRKESFKEKHGIKLGLTSFFVKSAIGALKKFPRVNAEIDGDEMVLKYHYDIGIAIGDEDGLVVPILHNADRMSFAEIERNIQKFVEQARNKTLALDDLRGGTFTITNGGVFGSLLSTPILNPPQAGILGLHKIESRPIAVDNEVVVRSMMYIALSYDHRIIDGREAVQFLVHLKALAEDPERLLLEG